MALFRRWSRDGARGKPKDSPRPSPDSSHAFPEGILAMARLVELKVRGPVDALFSGEYHSVFKGRGIEFSEVREYQIGDDVRSIDWNVTARRGRPYIKQYVEERELNVLLVVDLSGSKEFGTGSKSNARVAVELAALLSLAAARNNDRVGLLLVTDRVELFVPPGTGRRQALRIVMEMLSFRPAGRETDLSPALEYVARAFSHRAIVFLVSDFVLDRPEDPRFTSLFRRVARQHDLVPVRLSDPAEFDLPDLGMVALVDPERGDRVLVDTRNPEVREAYRRRVADARQVISSLFLQSRVEALEIDTRQDYVEPLVRYFRRRERLNA